jgi:hypothetical protein
MISRAEAVTAQFYQWEVRCRGWEIYPYPVDLEPPFVPFFSHAVRDIAVEDDSLQLSLVNKVVEGLKTAFTTVSKASIDPEDDAPVAPFPFTADGPLIAFSLSLPKEQKIIIAEIEQLLCVLSQSYYPISFEIIGTYSFIRIQFVCNEKDAEFVHNQVKAYFPHCGIQDAPIDDIIPENTNFYRADFGLREETMLPLATPKTLDIDPLIGVFAILENLKKDEQIVLQVLFKGTANPWSESIIRSVSDGKGGSFFADAPEMLKFAQEKTPSPLYAVVIRVIGFSNTKNTANIERMVNTLIQATQSSNNGLILLPNIAENDDPLDEIILRQSHRLGMLLNSKELSTFVHFPSPSVVSNKLIRDTRKTKEPPPVFLNHKLVFGTNLHQGNETLVSISDTQRLKHTHIIGATGTGKSTLLLTSIIQDIANGEGIAVLDPHGDLIESVQSWIHPDRHKDVLIIDPADSEYPVGFNILTAHSEIEKDILSSDLVAAFRRLSTSWGDQMNSVLANAILAFLESTKGGTLIELRRFLIEKTFRDHFLTTVTDPSIVYYWRHEFPIIKNTSIGSILTRLDSFLRPKAIRNMVAQNKSLDFEQILDTKKIVLIKLSQGLIGTENSYLLGTFLVSKIQQAAMARQAKEKADRTNFYLYIDEFQNFITPSMSAILSGARKYHLGLILVHQDMQQLNKYDTELASSVVANAGTRICFRLGDIDAKRFESGFSYFDANDLQNLDTGQAIIRIERPENDCNLQTLPFEELPVETAREIKERVITASRETYGTPKKDVEQLLKNMHTAIQYSAEPQIPNVASALKPIAPAKPDTEQPIEPFIPSSTKKPQEKKTESQHRYLQTYIKRMAESRGYIASIEEPTPDGKGKVDVSLARNNKRIAIEINDTSKDEWELHNIEKCLNAGYDLVVACSTDVIGIERMRSKIKERFDETLCNKILASTPDALFLFLDSEAAKEASSETRIKGYRIKVDYEAIPESEMTRKREAIAKSVIQTMRSREG